MANLYTIVLEFRGGTFVSQVRADDELDAVRCWADRFKEERPIPRSSSHIAASVLRGLEDSGLAPLEGLEGVWCFTGMSGDSQALGTLVLSR